MTSSNHERDFKIALLDYINEVYRKNYTATDFFIYDKLCYVRGNKRYERYYAEIEAYMALKKLLNKNPNLFENNNIKEKMNIMNLTISDALINSKIDDITIFKDMTAYEDK